MIDEALKAPPAASGERWHLSFFISYHPDELHGKYINCQISHLPPGTHPREWKLDGIASFEGPDLTPPRRGAETIPYLLFHLDEIKAWLVEEHVRHTFNGSAQTISDEVGIPVGPVVGDVE